MYGTCNKHGGVWDINIENQLHLCLDVLPEGSWFRTFLPYMKVSTTLATVPPTQTTSCSINLSQPSRYPIPASKQLQAVLLHLCVNRTGMGQAEPLVKLGFCKIVLQVSLPPLNIEGFHNRSLLTEAVYTSLK